MRSVIILFLLFQFLNGSAIAQAKKDTVGVTDFSSKAEGYNQFLNLITEKMVETFSKSGRFFMVDLTTAHLLDRVIDRAQENYKGNWLEANAKINPKIVITGQLNVLKFVRIVSNASPGYKATIQLVLKVVESETSKIVDSFEFTGVSTDIALTQEGSVQNALSGMDGQVIYWIGRRFPLKLAVVKVSKESAKSVEEVVIAGGVSSKVSVGDQFDIVLLDKSFSPPIPEIIGTGSVTAVLNENYSSLKILNGDKIKLKKSLAETKNSVYLQSKN